MNGPLKLILASASPRRQELVPLLGISWEVLAVDVDEESIDDPDPAANVKKTAELKADEAAHLAPPDAIIMAADTTVVLDGRYLNKPVDEDEARQMLESLRGRTHQVFTGIAVINKGTGQKLVDVAIANVPMRNFSDQEIADYVGTGDPLDKAGAYAIQHPDFQPVIDFMDCYAAVVGLPLCHAARAIKKTGVVVSYDVADKCQAHHNYDCPIFESILKDQ